MAEETRQRRSRMPVLETTQAGRDHDSEPDGTTAAGHTGIMRQLTRDAWTFRGMPVDHTRRTR